MSASCERASGTAGACALTFSSAAVPSASVPATIVWCSDLESVSVGVKSRRSLRLDGAGVAAFESIFDSTTPAATALDARTAASELIVSDIVSDIEASAPLLLPRHACLSAMTVRAPSGAASG